MWLKAKNTIKDGNKEILPGEKFEMDDKQGKSLIALDAAEEAAAPEAIEEKTKTTKDKK